MSDILLSGLSAVGPPRIPAGLPTSHAAATAARQGPRPTDMDKAIFVIQAHTPCKFILSGARVNATPCGYDSLTSRHTRRLTVARLAPSLRHNQPCAMGVNPPPWMASRARLPLCRHAHAGQQNPTSIRSVASNISRITELHDHGSSRTQAGQYGKHLTCNTCRRPSLSGAGAAQPWRRARGV